MQNIKLNVCGVKFECSKATLEKSEYFKSFFEEFPNFNEELYIERSPVIFKHILSLLIDDEYPFPLKYEKELKYFLMKKEEVKVIKICINHCELTKKYKDRLGKFWLNADACQYKYSEFVKDQGLKCNLKARFIVCDINIGGVHVCDHHLKELKNGNLTLKDF